MVSRSIEYAYDADGNRIQKTENGVVTFYDYDVAGRLATETVGSAVTTYVHDAAGNLVRKETPSDLIEYAWDARRRLTKAMAVAGDTDFAYDALGRRKRKETPGGEVSNYVYDRNHLLLETDGDGDSDRLYTFNDDEWGDLIGEWDSELGSRQHLYDGQWSTQALLDDAQNVTDRYRYTAFGLQEKLSGDYDSRMTFVGKQGYYQDDDLGLYYLGLGNSRGGGRFYDPALGRFLSEDPLRQASGDDNLYRYVKNNPINVIDPSGEESTCGTGASPTCNPQQIWTDAVVGIQKFIKEVQAQEGAANDIYKSFSEAWNNAPVEKPSPLYEGFQTLLGPDAKRADYAKECLCAIGGMAGNVKFQVFAAACIQQATSNLVPKSPRAAFIKASKLAVMVATGKTPSTPTPPKICWSAAAALLPEPPAEKTKASAWLAHVIDNLDHPCVMAFPEGEKVVKKATEYKDSFVKVVQLLEDNFNVENRDKIVDFIVKQIGAAGDCVLQAWSKVRSTVENAGKGAINAAISSNEVWNAIVTEVMCLNLDAIEGVITQVLKNPGEITQDVAEAVGGTIFPVQEFFGGLDGLRTGASEAFSAFTQGEFGTAATALGKVLENGLKIVDAFGLYLALLAIVVPAAIGSIVPAAGNAAGAGIGKIVNWIVGGILFAAGALLDVKKGLTAGGEIWTMFREKALELDGQLPEGATLDDLAEQHPAESDKVPLVEFTSGEIGAVAEDVNTIVEIAVMNGIAAASALAGAAFRNGLQILRGRFLPKFKKVAREKAEKRLYGCDTNRRSCFPAGTPIRVAEGTRPVESIREGDLVWSSDPEAEVWSLKEVIETYEVEYVGELATVDLDSGETIRATASHPFWVEAGEGLEDRPRIEKLEEERSFAYAIDGQETSTAVDLGRWVYACDLRPGDILVSLDLGRIVVESVSLSDSCETTHNFHVADLRTYAVGEIGILVHNDSEDSRDLNARNKSCGDSTGDDKPKEGEDDDGDLPKSPSPEAKKIANGHAWDKHVVKRNEYPEITTREQFEQLVDRVMSSPENKDLTGDRKAWWSDAEATVVIQDPKNVDGGTAFRPVNGKPYYDNLK